MKSKNVWGEGKVRRRTAHVGLGFGRYCTYTGEKKEGSNLKIMMCQCDGCDSFEEIEMRLAG